MTRFSGPRLFSGLVLVLAVAAVTGAGTLAGSGPAASTPDGTGTRAAVRQVPLAAEDPALACSGAPRLVAADDAPEADEEFGASADTEALVRAVALGATASASPPSLRVMSAAGTAEGPGGAPVPTVQAADPGPTVARADAASGRPRLAALQTALTVEGDLRGLAASTCSPPAEQVWLVGGGTAAGTSTRLELANPGLVALAAAVTVLTPVGPVEPPSAQRVTVAPGETVELLLEALVPGADALAVGVTATGGAVAASLVEARLAGLTPRGVDTVVPGGGPGLRQVVPGVHAAAGSPAPRLRLGVPGGEDAVVRWQVHGPSGPVGSGSAATTVSAGTVAEVVLDALERGDHTLVVESDVPVVAAAVSAAGGEGGDGAVDIAWSASTAALDRAAVLAVPADVGAALVLSATGGPASVDVRAVAADGSPAGSRRVDVPEAATVRLDLARIAGGAAAVTVTVVGGDGEVHAAVLLTAEAADGGRLVSVAAVRPQEPGPGTVRVRPMPDGRWP